MAARFAETISILLTNTKSISVTVKKSLWPYFVTQITHIQTLWPHKSPLIMSTLTLVTNIFTTFLLFALRLSYLNLPWLYSLYRLGTERMRTFASTREHHICTFRNRPIFYFSAWLMIFFFNRFFLLLSYFSSMCSSAVSRIQHFFDELWIVGSIHIPILNFTFYAHFHRYRCNYIVSLYFVGCHFGCFRRCDYCKMRLLKIYSNANELDALISLISEYLARLSGMRADKDEWIEYCFLSLLFAVSLFTIEVSKKNSLELFINYCICNLMLLFTSFATCEFFVCFFFYFPNDQYSNYTTWFVNLRSYHHKSQNYRKTAQLRDRKLNTINWEMNIFFFWEK